MQLIKAYIMVILMACLLAACHSTRIAQKSQTHQPSAAILKDSTRLKIYKDSLFFIAENAKLNGDYKSAIQAFNEYLKLDNNNPTVYYEVSRLFGKLKNDEAALAYANKAVEIDSTNRWFQMAYADALAMNKQFGQAADVFIKLHHTNPYKQDYLFNEGLFLSQAHRYDEALRAFDELEKEVGTDEQVIYQKQNIYQKKGAIDSAAAEIKKLIAKDPEEDRYYGLLAQLYNDHNMPEKAFSVYRGLLKKLPNNPRALIAIALYYKRNNNDSAYYHYMKRAFGNPALDIDNKIAFVYPFLKYVEIDSTKSGEALALCKMIVHAHPDNAKAYALYGDMYSQSKKPDSALVMYRKAISLDSSSFEVWQQLMLIYSRQQQYDSLLKASNHVMRDFPEQFSGYYFNGAVNVNTQNYSEAIVSLKKALSLLKKAPEVKGQLYYLLGESYNGIKNYKASDSCFDLSLKYTPDNDLVLNNYSYYLSERDVSLEKAEQMSKAALGLKPDNYVYEDTYAWILFKLGKYKKAKEWMEKTLDHTEARKSAGYLEHYGDILYKLKNVEMAVKYWKLAKEKGAASPLLDQKIRQRKLITAKDY